ncbi:hypothetical protein HC026_03885 [Lactobacillus sp. LC28-10]|uniref:Uncharacterized protein n=1 Tax=Secundilactobacillus angelensis TaxID=2722706 RepID=A0ABX1KVY1_9LACO|nr:hypothetical protein [Secundilactobacillus angelensis]MCH5462456.1 hypothetical protein [Secundilactobacillus angelensis]NLR18062.1 hypothetical protein [Secundilactobacillus angelensis]
MEKRHILNKHTYFLGTLAVAVGYGLTQFPNLAYAASNSILAKVNRQNLTEAVFIGMGLFLCLLGLFGLDRYRARHPRREKTGMQASTEMTGSTSTQQ